MKIGKIKFEDILGDKGKVYDDWLDKQIEGYYLTYKQNIYSDKFDFSIERENCISEPIFLAKTIEEITNKIDEQLKKNKTNISNKNFQEEQLKEIKKIFKER